MNLLSKILKPMQAAKSASVPAEAWQEVAQARISIAREIARPYVADANFLRLFMSVPEVFFPIDFIASRIAKATFEVKRYSDDSVVWSRNKMLKVLRQPNAVMTWSEFVYAHFVYKLATGNAFVRAAMPEAFSQGKRYKMCDHFWPLPANDVTVEPPRTYNLPLFGICAADELIGDYRLCYSNSQPLKIAPWQVWHDRDGQARFDTACYMKAESRLNSVLKPISNLIAVYEARNVIYVKRGGIGFLVNAKNDETGSVALTPKEKQELEAEMDRYGIGDGQRPLGYTDVPLNFIRTNLSISELQPFEETLEDAVKIAGAYGIPDVLVPRRDHSTFSNQATAEKSAYCGVVIPYAKDFCAAMTTFLGLDQDGYYLDVNFSDVDCLQDGMSTAEDVKKKVNDRCRQQFMDGLISLNDWRAQIHESMIEDDEMFSKLKYMMSDEELARIDKIMNNAVTNNKSSNGDEERQRQGEEAEPGVQDQGQ